MVRVQGTVNFCAFEEIVIIGQIFFWGAMYQILTDKLKTTTIYLTTMNTK